MITIIKNICSIVEFLDNIFYIKSRFNKNRYINQYVFRGLKKESYELLSSLKRNCGNESHLLENRNDLHFFEKRLSINFEKYAQIIEPKVKNSYWERLIIAQHHGLPTRLLDWSYSPLIALHFATDHVDSDEKIEEDVAVWMISVEDIHALLPDKYIDMLKKYQSKAFTCDMLDELKIDNEQYDRDMGNDGFVFVEPPSIDMRIVNQGSLLSVIPNAIDPLERLIDGSEKICYKFIISKDKLESVRDELDILNVNERVLFPDLDGIAKLLRRRYYKGKYTQCQRKTLGEWGKTIGL